MTTYILPKDQIELYRKVILENKDMSEYESKIMIDMSLAFEELEIEEAKRKVNVGDCLIIKYDGKLVPFQILQKNVTKNESGEETIDCIMQSYYLLEKRAFDQKTNVWKDAEIRNYLNGEFKKKFDPEFIAALKPTEIHTDNYTTVDDFWLLSHEEIGYNDRNGMFKKNVGSTVYDFYKEEA